VKLSKMFLAAVAAAALVSVSGHAAVTTTKAIQVSAKVVTNCSISVSNNMDFGNYDPVGANAAGGSALTATSDITVVCTKGSSGVTVGLDQGANASATNRRLANAGEFLNYSIADDLGNAWTQSSSTVGGVTTVTGSVGYANFTSAAAGVTHRATATLPAGQDVSVGTYTDTVTATVLF